MDEHFKAGQFVLIFHGDVPCATVVEGWDGLLNFFKLELWQGGDGPPDEWAERVASLEDRSNWTPDDEGDPWHYHEDFEDGSMAVYRVNA